MGKHNKRRRSNQKRRRSSHPTPTHSAARRRRASDAPANRVPIPVPWVVLHEEGHPPLGVATDGSQTLTFEIASEERRVYAVFNAEGLLAEFIELVGPDSDEDDQLLQMFLHRRRAVSDPLFADQSLKAPAHGWRMPARRELHRFTYKHYPLAADSTRMVLAADECGHKWLFAITTEGVRFDGIWLDVINGMPEYQSERERFIAARRAAGDPMFGLGGRS